MRAVLAYAMDLLRTGWWAILLVACSVYILHLLGGLLCFFGLNYHIFLQQRQISHELPAMTRSFIDIYGYNAGLGASPFSCFSWLHILVLTSSLFYFRRNFFESFIIGFALAWFLTIAYIVNLVVAMVLPFVAALTLPGKPDSSSNFAWQTLALLLPFIWLTMVLHGIYNDYRRRSQTTVTTG